MERFFGGMDQDGMDRENSKTQGGKQ